MLCSYGCGKNAIHQLKNGKWCCSKHYNSCPAVRNRVKKSIKRVHRSGIYKEKIKYEKIKCKYCGEMIAQYLMNRHIKSCFMNPKNINRCKACGKIIGKYSSTCSLKCRYEYYGHPNQKNINHLADYRSICFHYHKYKCIVCGEENVVEVHHYDIDRNNSEKENLVPLCPTHHKYIHSEFEYLVYNLVEMFVLKQYKHMWE